MKKIKHLLMICIPILFFCVSQSSAQSLLSAPDTVRLQYNGYQYRANFQILKHSDSSLYIIFNHFAHFNNFRFSHDPIGTHEIYMDIQNIVVTYQPDGSNDTVATLIGRISTTRSEEDTLGYIKIVLIGGTQRPTSITEDISLRLRRNFAVIPNPAFDEVTVTGIPSTGNVLLKVFTVSGKEVFTAHGTPSWDALKLTLPASLSNGSYFMRVYDGENVLGSARFSIMR